MQLPGSTLVVLVVCSRDQTRNEVAVEVMKNLAELLPAAGLSHSFLSFDNGSIYRDHEAHVPKGAVVCRSGDNIGYWTALKWILDRRDELFDRKFEYLYIVESDHIHSDLRPLGLCERFLEAEPSASCVRTQTFAVSLLWRWRYNKRLWRLPFYDAHNAVQMFNAVTNEPAWFRKAHGFEPIYISNLHGKLPTLSRLSVMDEAFAKLATMEKFTEWHLFEAMMQDHPHIGVYDEGLFYTKVSSKKRDAIVSGSYTKEQDLIRMGYATTRTANIAIGPHKINVNLA